VLVQMAGMDLAQTLPMISTEATGVVEATVSAVYRKCIELLDTIRYITEALDSQNGGLCYGRLGVRYQMTTSASSGVFGRY
jgi:hypothetical protein